MRKKHRESGLEKGLEKAKKILLTEKALIIALIIIAIAFSTYFRMYPANLPITEQWAQDTYYNQIRASIGQQIDAQYPNLPTAQRTQYVEDQLDEYLKTNGETLDAQIQQSADYFKSRMQNDDGQTYLLAIDPYLWHSYAKNIEEYGHLGDTEVDGKDVFSLRNGREGKKTTSLVLHPYLITTVHKIGSVFSKGFDLLKAAFIIPVIIIGLAIIPAFFLGRKIGGNLGGFVAAMIIALNTALLGRTPAGFSDTDAYIILFPLLISWLFIEALDAKSLKNKLILGAATGLAFVLFRLVWQIAWHIGAILLGVAGVYFLYMLIARWKQIKKSKTLKQLFQHPSIKTVAIVIIFLISAMIFSGIIKTAVDPNTTFGENIIQPVEQIFVEPLKATSVKDVAGADIWPNVLTTVAELNEGSWKQIFASVGGKLFFIIGIIGMLLTLTLRTKENAFEIRYAGLIIIWSLVLIVASLMSARFIALLAAPFAIAYGSAFGIIWKKTEKFFTKNDAVGIIIKGALLLLVIGLFFTPVGRAHDVALSEVPSMNDGWQTSLLSIQTDTDDGIITSWWDFGHWFVNTAEQRVTFDGADQGKRIYWVGKSLMTDDLEENKDILRMLNCGQNKGYEHILEYTENNYLSSQLINTIIYEDEDEARTTLEENGLSETQIDDVLEKTHCTDYLDQYYIVSQDMIGKAGVWAHFGGWNFERAYIYNIAKQNSYDQALNTLQEKLELDEETAAQYYFEANSLETNRDVDTWISPWPGYVSTGAQVCQETNDTITCSIGQTLSRQGDARTILRQATVNKDNPEDTELLIQSVQGNTITGEDSLKPARVTIGNDDGFETVEIENPNFPYELVVATDEDGNYRAIIAEEALAESAFSKLFFFDGLGMEGYEKLSDLTTFNGQRIIVYKVDLS